MSSNQFVDPQLSIDHSPSASPGLAGPESAEGQEDASSSGTTNRRSRVHWDAAPIRRPRNPGQGPTVTVRSPPSGSVQRSLHPGPLNLTARLAEKSGELPQNENQPTIPTLSLQGARGLDEQGLDNRAFLELQRELQRHEATSGEGEELTNDEQLESHDRAMEMDQSYRNTERRRRQAPKTETPDWSSGVMTPVTDTTSDSGSYDPCADSDLDHVELVAGETDGLPSRIKSKKDDIDEQPKGWAKLRNILLKQPDKDDEEAPNEKTYEMGGPTNYKSVPVTTSSGTRPAGPKNKQTKYEREAARLIRAHKLMTGHGVDDAGNDAIRLGHMPSTRRSHLESGASTPDALDTAANLSSRPVTSGGVLGNLLRLYEQQQREEREAKKLQESRPSSTATSPLSTPAVGDTNLSELARKQYERDEARRLTGLDNSDVANTRRHTRPNSSPGYWTSELAGGIANRSKRAVAVAAKETGFDGLEDVVDERPKASRSGAGVMGALVATTGNLIGAVSPHHAQIGPNPKRPGYTLDRYLLPEMNAKTLRKTAEIVADAAPRPFRSQPGTPGRYSVSETPGAHSPDVFARKETRDSNETQADTPRSGTHSPIKSITRPSSLVNVRTGAHSRKGSGPLQSHLHLPHFSRGWTGQSNVNTPDIIGHSERPDYFSSEADEKAQKQEWQRKLRKRAKDKRRKEEIFITMHVAAILQRQEFLLKLARALMMFGAPTHRIETQIQQTARVLDINCRCIYLPNLMLFAFGDDATHTSETKFIKQPGGLDLTKLTDMHSIYWNVIHDKIGVDEASKQLDELMRRKPLIGRFRMVLIGGFCSAFISVGSQGFGGSFVDALAAFPLGMFLVFSQLVIKAEVFSNVFEILFAAINSFVASALASTDLFCYSGVVSGSIVLILPGFIVLSGALELQSKNLIAGSVRLVYAIIYSLFLGFGISIGSSFWLLFSGSDDSTLNYTSCARVQSGKPWWGQSANPYWAFLTVPGYATALSLRNQAKITRKEFPVMVLIAISGWAVNHFASQSKSLTSRSDVTSALGAFTVGILSNVFGRLYDGKSYTVAAVGVLYQLPSGLSNGNNTLLNFANNNQSSEQSFTSGFQVAQGLVEVALGLTVGLYAATVLAYVLGGRKIRGGGFFSF